MQVACDRPSAAEQTRAYVLGRLSESDEIDFENHLAGCHACAARVGDLDEALGRLARSAAGPTRAFTPMRAGAAIAAAAAGVLVAVTWARYRDAATYPAPGEETLRSVTVGRVELIAPRGDLDAMPEELRWREAEGRPPCHAAIVQPDLTPIWEGPASAESFITIPSEVRQALNPDTVYLWKVTCATGPGPIGSSYAEFRVRLRP